MKLYSHPRSGTNYLLSLLNRAFLGTESLKAVTTGHWSERIEMMVSMSHICGYHSFYHPALEAPRIYAIRDGRDVALSLWRAKGFQHKVHRELSFSAYLRTPLDWHATPGNRASVGLNVVQHWREHVESWHNAPHTVYVRYEEILLDATRQLERIAEFTGEKVLERKPQVGDAGPFPSGDYRLDKWRDIFTDEDLDFFFGIVPEDHWGLWDG